MWQKLHDELKDRNFTVVTVAMDSAEAARPWIEAAKPAHPSLIDRDHHVADLYNMVNVPQAAWIDEQGRFVRPPENAGSSNAFVASDRSTRQMTEAQLTERARMKSVYVEAVRDWVINGPMSEHALDATAAQSRVRLPDEKVAAAHAHFRLARFLLRRGKADEAAFQFAEASRLHPASWNIWRQAAQKDDNGFAAGPEFWARVDALGDRPYHLPIAMKGIAESA